MKTKKDIRFRIDEETGTILKDWRPGPEESICSEPIGSLYHDKSKNHFTFNYISHTPMELHLRNMRRIYIWNQKEGYSDYTWEVKFGVPLNPEVVKKFTTFYCSKCKGSTTGVNWCENPDCPNQPCCGESHDKCDCN